MRRDLTLSATLAMTIAMAGVVLDAQIQRPRVDLTPSAVPSSAAPGSKVRASLKVQLPKDVHVQSDKPRDAALIATALTVTPPAGVTVDRIVYPVASDLKQAGRETPLAVFGPEFVVEVQLSVAPTVSPGEIKVPAQLRYQACNEQVCFPPSRTPVEWSIAVAAR